MQKIIKDNVIVDDNWTYISDEEDLAPGHISVSVARLKKDRELLLSRKEPIGIRIRPDDATEEIAADLSLLQLIELDFPALADGRLFSHAWLLRGRYHYGGEIRATGNYLPDQMFYLSRVGVNAFATNKPEELEMMLTCLNDFSVKYQSSIN